jgi:hypothetical protein
MNRHIERVGRGAYALSLSAEERSLLRALHDQLRDLLTTDDPGLVRVFPPAYDDPQDEQGYRELMRGELLAGRLNALDAVERTLDARRLSEDELTSWLGALNDLRLVLGTRLGVTEELYGRPIDPDDPHAPALGLYGWLGWLQEEAVEALAAELG